MCRSADVPKIRFLKISSKSGKTNLCCCYYYYYHVAQRLPKEEAMGTADARCFTGQMPFLSSNQQWVTLSFA